MHNGHTSVGKLRKLDFKCRKRMKLRARIGTNNPPSDLKIIDGEILGIAPADPAQFCDWGDESFTVRNLVSEQLTYTLTIFSRVEETP